MKKCPYCSEEIQDEAKKCRFCGEWIKEELIENVKEEDINVKEEDIIDLKEKEKDIIDLKEKEKEIEIKKERFFEKYGKKIIIFLLFVLYFLLSIATAFIYIINDDSSLDLIEKIKNFTGIFLAMILIGLFHYFRGAKKVKENFKGKLLLISRGLLFLILTSLGLFYLYIYENKYIDKIVENDLNNISDITRNNSSNLNNLDNSISSIQTESKLGQKIQYYIVEKSNIDSILNKEINELGEVFLASKNYTNTSEINIIIKNLDKLGNITKEYKNSIDDLNNKNDFKDLLNTTNILEINKRLNDFIQAEKEFIQSSKNAYNFLLENQNEIQTLENGEIGIYDDYIRNKFNELIEIMKLKIKNYNKKINELDELRE